MDDAFKNQKTGYDEKDIGDAYQLGYLHGAQHQEPLTNDQAVRAIKLISQEPANGQG